MFDSPLENTIHLFEQLMYEHILDQPCSPQTLSPSLDKQFYRSVLPNFKIVPLQQIEGIF